MLPATAIGIYRKILQKLSQRSVKPRNSITG
jgi:hypothetical protein